MPRTKKTVTFDNVADAGVQAIPCARDASCLSFESIPRHSDARIPFISCEQISNGGNVDLADVHVSSSELMVACDDRQSLGVGHSYSCGGSYSVLSLDITAGLTESAVT